MTFRSRVAHPTLHLDGPSGIADLASGRSSMIPNTLHTSTARVHRAFPQNRTRERSPCVEASMALKGPIVTLLAGALFAGVLAAANASAVTRNTRPYQSAPSPAAAASSPPAASASAPPSP